MNENLIDKPKSQADGPIEEKPNWQNSKCSTKNEEKLYLNQLLGNKKLITALLFRGSDHGWNAKEFHERCDKKGPTVSLFKVKNGDCIGGYTKC